MSARLTPAEQAKLQQIANDRGRTVEEVIVHAVRGLLAKTAKPGGMPPYGWRRDAAGQLEPDAEQQRIVRRIEERADAGASLQCIADELNGTGVRRPGGALWRSESVRRVLARSGRVPGRVRAGRGGSAQPQARGRQR